MGQVAKGARFNRYLLNRACFLLRVERDPRIIYIGILLGLKQTHGFYLLLRIERDPWITFELFVVRLKQTQ